jgi:hypothetical protein
MRPQRAHYIDLMCDVLHSEAVPGVSTLVSIRWASICFAVNIIAAQLNTYASLNKCLPTSSHVTTNSIQAKMQRRLTFFVEVPLHHYNDACMFVPKFNVPHLL